MRERDGHHAGRRAFHTRPWLSSFQCSVTCERGTQKRFLKCAEKYVSGKYRELASRKCLHLPQPQLELQRACARFPCPKRPAFAAAGPPRTGWFASPWSQVGMKGWRAEPLLGVASCLGPEGFCQSVGPWSQLQALPSRAREVLGFWGSGLRGHFHRVISKGYSIF